MFAFEFAILLITSIGILSRYVLGLVEKYVLRREAIRRKEARAIEHAASRQRRRDENEQRRVAGEEVEEEDEDTGEDEDDEELDVGGWEEKGTWVFYSELCTGVYHFPENRMAA
jgi:E3 ubiquitin-protein ligase synoviolin